MARNHLPEYPYTPEWDGNRTGEDKFVAWLRDLSLSDSDKLDDAIKRDIADVKMGAEQTKQFLRQAVVRFENFVYAEKEINSADDLIEAGCPITLATELIQRWLSGRPSEAELKNLKPSSGS